jgi:hypothetical protein
VGDAGDHAAATAACVVEFSTWLEVLMSAATLEKQEEILAVLGTLTASIAAIKETTDKIKLVYDYDSDSYFLSSSVGRIDDADVLRALDYPRTMVAFTAGNKLTVMTPINSHGAHWWFVLLDADKRAYMPGSQTWEAFTYPGEGNALALTDSLGVNLSQSATLPAVPDGRYAVLVYYTIGSTLTDEDPIVVLRPASVVNGVWMEDTTDARASFAGTGEFPINHDSGGTDALRATSRGVGVGSVTVRAYLQEDYVAGDRTIRGQATTNDAGRWIQDMMLNALRYILTFDAEGYSLPDADITVAADGAVTVN